MLSRMPKSDPLNFDISFDPPADTPDQHQESYTFTHEGKRRRLRIHDYDQMYKVPGLYEALVYDRLECRSPVRVTTLFDMVLKDWPASPRDLRVLDLGAGNGIVGELLREIGVEHVVGLDLLPEAAAAARRDRPEVYADYLVADLTKLSADEQDRLRGHELNALVTVAALGFGDIPPDAFANAFNLIAGTGWVAMTIKEDFLHPSDDDSGFARLVRRLVQEQIFDVQAHHRFRHRLAIDGTPLHYVAVVGRKTADIPESWIESTPVMEVAPEAATANAGLMFDAARGS